VLAIALVCACDSPKPSDTKDAASAKSAKPAASASAAPAPSSASPAASGAASAAPSASAEAGGSVKGSCHNVPQGFCNEFTGSMYTPEQIKSACGQQGVSLLTGPCPGADRVGQCLVYAGMPTESRYHYYKSFPGGVAAAEKQCKELLKGTWTAG
jgi:hypothetical protein